MDWVRNQRNQRDVKRNSWYIYILYILYIYYIYYIYTINYNQFLVGFYSHLGGWWWKWIMMGSMKKAAKQFFCCRMDPISHIYGMIWENPIQKWMMNRGTHIDGNPKIWILLYIQSILVLLASGLALLMFIYWYTFTL